MTTELISRCLTPGEQFIGIWSLIGLEQLTPPCAIQSSTPNNLLTEANPKAISRRTSYLRFRLEFLRYPQLIPCFFNSNVVRSSTVCYHRFNLLMDRSIGFGSMSCNYLALFKLAFATAPKLNFLTSLHNITRRPVLQKVRHGTISSALSACKHTVSGTISPPSRGTFHLSLTVLYTIGH